MPKMKALSSLTLVLSDVTIAFVLTMFLIAWAPNFASLGFQGFVLLFILTAAFVALVTVVSLSFARPNAAAKRVIAARDLAIQLRERALNEHTIVTMSHPDGRIAAVNQNFIDTLGYSADEIVGELPETIYWTPGDGDAGEVQDLIKAGKTWKGTQRLRTKDDTCITVETTILPRFDDAGSFENSIAIRTDVTRAKAEGVEEGRNAVIEALPDEVYLYDPDTFELNYANENARRRFRRNREELQGVSLLNFFTDEEERRFKRHIAPVVSGEAQRARLELDHISGPVEIVTHLDGGPNGPKMLVSVVRDISDRKDAEAKQLNSIATVSHELRTPLTSIKGALRLIESGVTGDLAPDAARMITVARRNSDRLLAIVNDILVLEKLTSGEIALRKKCVDLQSLAREATEANAAFAADSNVDFVLEAQDGPAFVDGDPDRLMQVMSNLMSNAAKFSPENCSVTLTIEDRDDMWRVSVIDRGPGIPEAARKTLFENFTQVAGTSSKRQEGTGLGLAICREIITRHGGLIAFESEVGVGSTFYFELEKRAPATASDETIEVSVA